MENSKKVNIVRVDQSGKSIDQNPQSAIPNVPVLPKNVHAFQSMPQLYLELLENKNKIRQNLVNKEYDPAEVMSTISYFDKPETKFPLSTKHSKSNPLGPTDDEASVHSSGSGSSRASSSHSSRRSGSYQEEDDGEPVSGDESGDDVSSVASFRGQRKEAHGYHHQPQRHGMGEDSDQDDDVDGEEEDDDDGSSAYSGSVRSGRGSSARNVDPNRVRQRYEKVLDEAIRTQTDPSGGAMSMAPRLSDLTNARQQQFAPDLNRLHATDEDKEREEEMKRELLFKFELLKRNYSHVDVGHFSIHSDLKTMIRSYENAMRRISLDSSVDSYKSYLIGGFMVMEFVLQSYVKMDMQGFTQQQIVNMNQYERVLTELGEKTYTPGGSAYSPELRLVGLVLLNGFIFIVSKIIMKKTGTSIVSMMNSMSRSVSPSSPAAGPPHVAAAPPVTHAAMEQPKRKMRGPAIDLEDLPEL